MSPIVQYKFRQPSKSLIVYRTHLKNFSFKKIEGDTEQYVKAHQARINRGVIVACSIIGAIVLFFIIDIVCLMKTNCGFLAFLRKYCGDDKANSSEFKS